MRPGAVRTALEHAVWLAREADAVPKELRPLVEFRQLPGPALATVLRVLDTDADFRRWVVERTDPSDVDAAGWLVLTRPRGWEDLLDQVVEARSAQASSSDVDRRVREFERRLETAERKRDEADRRAADLAEEAAAAGEALSGVRRERRRAERALERSRAEAAAAQEHLDERERRLEEAQGALAAHEHELVAARCRVEALQQELAQRPPTPPPGESRVDVHRLRTSAEELEKAAARLQRAVDAVTGEVPEPPVPSVAAEPHRPQQLPGGVVEDSPDGARWLLGRPWAVLVVDGYNVSMRAWPDQALAEQRRRLVTGLDGLASRTGAEVHVVFDGLVQADAGATTRSPSVQVRFTPGTEADDVVIDLAGAWDPGRPVVVASDDREVREGARRQGANVIGSQPLLALLTT